MPWRYSISLTTSKFPSIHLLMGTHTQLSLNTFYNCSCALNSISWNLSNGNRTRDFPHPHVSDFGLVKPSRNTKYEEFVRKVRGWGRNLVKSLQCFRVIEILMDNKMGVFHFPFFQSIHPVSDEICSSSHHRPPLYNRRKLIFVYSRKQTISAFLPISRYD